MDDLFEREIEINPEVYQSFGDGISRPASGQQGFEEPPNKRLKQNVSFGEESVVVEEKLLIRSSMHLLSLRAMMTWMWVM